MTFQKYGSPQPIEPEATDDQRKTASKQWSDTDRKELNEELQRDAPDGSASSQ